MKYSWQYRTVSQDGRFSIRKVLYDEQQSVEHISNSAIELGNCSTLEDLEIQLKEALASLEKAVLHLPSKVRDCYLDDVDDYYDVEQLLS